MALGMITFKHTHAEHTGRLEAVVVNKFQSLNRYVGNETDVRCEVEFQKVAPRQSGMLYRVEANMWLAGKLFRAEATDENFEKAIDIVRSELDTEMHKSHTKRESLMRRGGRKFKEMLRWGR